MKVYKEKLFKGTINQIWQLKNGILIISLLGEDIYILDKEYNVRGKIVNTDNIIGYRVQYLAEVSKDRFITASNETTIRLWCIKTFSLVKTIIDYGISNVSLIYSMIGLTTGHVYSAVNRNDGSRSKSIHGIWDVDNSISFKLLYEHERCDYGKHSICEIGKRVLFYIDTSVFVYNIPGYELDRVWDYGAVIQDIISLDEGIIAIRDLLNIKLLDSRFCCLQAIHCTSLLGSTSRLMYMNNHLVITTYGGTYGGIYGWKFLKAN
jgi:hypothetical protein